MKLLVTGFPKFDRFEENATQTLVESMRDDLPKELASLADHLAFGIVHFENDDSATQKRTMLQSAHHLLAEHEPDVCLFCGLAASRSWITLETIAINVFKGDLIDPDGPPAYWATIPEQEELVATLRAAEIPAKLSYHAGTHLCNHILYTGLRLAETSDRGMRCGFLHLPMSNTQVIHGDEDRAFIPLGMTRRALTMAIQHVVDRA